MFLTKSTTKKTDALRALAIRARRLPSPATPLYGDHRPPPPLPENIICFQRNSGAALNRPQTGRALHHRHVLIVPLSGHAVVCVDDHDLALSPGKGLVILPYQYHHYRAASAKLLWLFITFEYAQGLAMESLRNLVFKTNASLAEELGALLDAQRNLVGGGLPELRLALLLSHLPTHSGPAAAGANKMGARTTLRLRTEHAAQQHRPAAPRIRELANDLGVSESHLRTSFRNSCGTSLGRHLRQRRLERACGLLRMTHARVSEIAEQCGFNSLFTFSRAFKQHYGQSPSEFRNSAVPELGGKSI